MGKRETNEWDNLCQRARALRLWGLDAHWEELKTEPWVAKLIAIEEEERLRRSMEFRLKSALLGKFKPISLFDWEHPTKINRSLVESLFELKFIEDEMNVIFAGSNGLGKSMLAKNLAYHALVNGHSVKYVTASELLVELSGHSGSALERRLRYYTKFSLLVVDEVGYLSYDNRHADLLFQVVTRRYEEASPIVVTTNRAFAEWNEVFSSSACVTTLVDRLCHRAEIVKIEGESFRAKEALERAKERGKTQRKSKKLAPKPAQE